MNNPKNDLPSVDWRPASSPPAPHETVLLYLPGAENKIWLGYFDSARTSYGEKPIWRDISDAWLYGDLTPTHWASLARFPEPQKEGQ